ncbi:hypothetical protein FIM02_00990 [SAR202 cluster bacterium AD-802-E10_MRT_200m]|nr:hypothetical protein [SAR202 cluster bacterium AD-802-E10_MRT_200m]
MTMDMSFPVDLDAVSRTIDDAEILIIILPMLRKSLLIDLRCTSEISPYVKVVPMVKDPEERIRFIRRTRPNLPRPRQLAAVAWTKLVGSIARLGVSDQILKRLSETGYPSAVQSYLLAFEELEKLERAELSAVIQGDHYHTVWTRGQ